MHSAGSHIMESIRDAVILFQDNQQRRYCSTVDYNVKKLFDEREMVDHALEQKAERYMGLLSTEPPRGWIFFKWGHRMRNFHRNIRRISGRKEECGGSG